MSDDGVTERKFRLLCRGMPGVVLKRDGPSPNHVDASLVDHTAAGKSREAIGTVNSNRSVAMLYYW